MSGQDTVTLEDPLFSKLESWQRENPVRRRVNSSDLAKEHGNFVTYCGHFRRKRVGKRDENSSEVDEFQLADHHGVVFIKPTKFISRDDIKKVKTISKIKERSFGILVKSGYRVRSSRSS